MSSSEQTFSTNDLRSNSVERQRFQEQKHKWALGQAWGPGRNAEGGHHPKPARKHEIVTDAQYISGDSSTDEEVEAPSVAPDVDVAYSYDAQRSPSQGSQILSFALAKAVERFESTATDKLVNDEYEVLDSEGEAVPTTVKRGKGAKKMPTRAEPEDDYEFV
ncbi:hypothetical protein K402DRAFT_375813 [Aulographum hederae CBS 113979]|uniref:Uncharacterized protein n=1 Tax=Aulographum hederae CBS 113979 TaxID=1176131 RepID=A0A6G1H1Z5_9PEZI|nr:hypothetical protein K402DRAFT_375813 [Aulographum hederae CBS 113979]